MPQSDPNPYAPPQVSGRDASRSPLDGERFAACNLCGCEIAKRVGFTWWGGALGPYLFTHVKCAKCGNKYNGKTGRSNATAIAIYFGVSLVIGAVLGLALAYWLTLNKPGIMR